MSSHTEDTGRFKVGDIVQLKSGGPRMTVGEKPLGVQAQGVFCQWFSGKKLSSGFFTAASLIRPQSDAAES